MAKYRARYYIEVDVDIVCDWENTEEKEWGLNHLKAASGIFICGDIGDVLESGFEVQEVKVFKTSPDSPWKEVS